MKTCLRLTFFVCLPVTMLMTAAAQEKPAQVSACSVGVAFTITVPVRLPVGMSVEYEWYRNDTAIAGTKTTPTMGVTAIAYTIPAEEAHGASVVYYFRYCLNDDCDEWTSSPKYVINFLPPNFDCVLSAAGNIEGDDVDLSCQLSNGGSVEGDDVDLGCQLSNGGSIEADDVDLSCQLSNGGSVESD